jgi:tetrahydromethanopterin S-methyltransferase subunit G
MTPDEIDRIMERLDQVENRLLRGERLLFVVLGALLGSGVLQLWQVVG